MWATSWTVRMRAVFSMYLLSPVRSRERPVGTIGAHFFFRMIFESRKIHLANPHRRRLLGILGALFHRLLLHRVDFHRKVRRSAGAYSSKYRRSTGGASAF